MSKKIYIVEDDESIRELLSMVLRNAGYEIKLYPMGNEIKKNNNPSPDLFLLDKQLPDIDGMDICRYLKSNQQTKKIPVVMISASPQLDLLSKEAGADGFIEKPFSLSTLLTTVSSILNEPRL